MWNYHDDDLLSAPDAPVELSIADVPAAAKRVLLRHNRIDHEHSNAYTAWKSMGRRRTRAPNNRRSLDLRGNGK